MHILKVYGPNLSGPFDADYDTYMLEDPVEQAEVDNGYLVVKLPAYDGRAEEVVTDWQGEPVRRIPARKPRGPMTIQYAPGQWSKTVVFEKFEEER